MSEFEENRRTKSQGSLRAHIRFYEALGFGLRRALASQEREPASSVHDGRSDEDSGDDLKEQGECERVHAAVGRPVERRRPRERHEQHRAAQDAWVGCSGEAHVRAAEQAELLPVRCLPHPERDLHAVEHPHRRHPPQSDEVRHVDDDVVGALLMEQAAAAHVLSAFARAVRATAHIAAAERQGENRDPPQKKVADGHAVRLCPAPLFLVADADHDQQDEPVPAKKKAEAGPRHVHRGELQRVGEEGLHRNSSAASFSRWERRGRGAARAPARGQNRAGR